MPDSAPAELPLSSFLTYRLSSLSQLLNRASARWHQRNSGLNLAEWRVIASMGFFGPMSPSDVADRTTMDKAVVSRVKAALLKQNLIHEQDDPADSRKRILVLSDGGRDIYERIIPLAQERQMEMINTLSADEIQVLNGCMEKLQHFMEREASQ